MLGIIKYIGFFILFGLGIGQQLIYVRIKQRWERLPVVAATVIESKLIDYNDLNGNRHYHASIKYEYEFRGETYVAETPALQSLQLFPEWELPRKLLRKYKEGDIVNAKVIPATPELAYLEIIPVNKISLIGAPVLVVLYILFVLGYASVFLSSFGETIEMFKGGGSVHSINM